MGNLLEEGWNIWEKLVVAPLERKNQTVLFFLLSLSTSAHFPMVARGWFFIASLYTSSQNKTLEIFLRSHLLNFWVSRYCPCLWIPIPNSWVIEPFWPIWVWFGCQNLTPVNETNGGSGERWREWQLTEKRCHWEFGRYPKVPSILLKVSN